MSKKVTPRGIKLIEVNCPFCDSSRKRLLYLCKRELNIQNCSMCNMQYISPRLDEASQHLIYSEKDYYSCWALESDDVATALMKKQTANQILDIIEKNQLDKGNLLEIGCAVGFFLEEAVLREWQVYGLDLSPYAIEQARKRLGEKAELIQGLLQEESFAGEQFSAVVLLDVIEHVESPIEFLKLIKQKTADRGLLYILTPNSNSLSRYLFGAKWPHYKWEHLFYLDNTTAKKLLSAAGWQIIETRAFAKPISFNYIKSHYQKFPHFPFTQLLNVFSWLLPAFIKRLIIPLFMGQMLIIAKKTEG